MGTTVWDELSRVSELAELVLEAAQSLQATAVGSTEGEILQLEPTGAELFEYLLESERPDPALVNQRAAALGCDLVLGAVAVCVELRMPRPALVGRLITEECDDALVQGLERRGHQRVYAILPCVRTCVAGTIGGVRELTARLSVHGLVGVSSYEAEPGGLGRALREAELVVDVIRESGEHVAKEAGRGITALLLRMLASHPAEMRDFHDTTIGPLVDYDRHRGAELVPTLRAYLACECNMNVTAATVFAHRHTVAARLERIRELTGLDPLRHEDREQLGLGLKVNRLLAPQLEALSRPGGRAAVPA